MEKWPIFLPELYVDQAIEVRCGYFIKFRIRVAQPVKIAAERSFLHDAVLIVVEEAGREKRDQPEMTLSEPHLIALAQCVCH